MYNSACACDSRTQAIATATYVVPKYCRSDAGALLFGRLCWTPASVYLQLAVSDGQSHPFWQSMRMDTALGISRCPALLDAARHEGVLRPFLPLPRFVWGPGSVRRVSQAVRVPGVWRESVVRRADSLSVGGRTSDPMFVTHLADIRWETRRRSGPRSLRRSIHDRTPFSKKWCL